MAIAVLVYFYIIIYMDYIQCVLSTRYIDFDIKTLTASDFSVEFDIEPTVLQHFTDKYYDETNPIDLVSQLKLFIKIELNKRINSMPDLGYHD